jgi:hypothetical protein
VIKVWLKNRSPHAKLHKQTPFERWTGSNPDLFKLHVFGTTGYAHIPKDFRKKAKGVPPKFINHTKLMIFVADLKKNIHSRFPIKYQEPIYFWLNMLREATTK